jgi:hypothetical protein
MIYEMCVTSCRTAIECRIGLTGFTTNEMRTNSPECMSRHNRLGGDRSKSATRNRVRRGIAPRHVRRGWPCFPLAEFGHFGARI